MDLNKVIRQQVKFETEINYDDFQTMMQYRNVCVHNFDELKIRFYIRKREYNGSIFCRVKYSSDDDYDNLVLVSYKIILSSGKKLEDSTIYGFIDLMSEEELSFWQAPRKILVQLNVGVYYGEDQDQAEDILTEVEDFVPLSSPSTFFMVKMEGLLQSGHFTDVTLACDGGGHIYAHKCLLISSPYFLALFASNFAHSHQKVVGVEHDYNTMQVLVFFLYTGTVKEDEVSNWPDLYVAASFYNVEVLERHCELQMMTTTRVTSEWKTIKELLRFSIIFGAFKLKNYLKLVAWRIQENL